MKQKEIKSIIGFDLGHGETSLAFSILSSDDQPKIIEIENRKSIVTAFGTSLKAGKVIGEMVFRIPDLENLFFAFKKAPSEIGFSENLIIEYTKIVFSKIPTNLLDLNNTHVFVGCPSGWSNQDVESYENVFVSALGQNVKVVKESRAALLQGKESGLIESKNLKSSALVIDVGSLTTDISHIYAGTEDEKIDIGISLGSGLIDESIFKKTIELSNDPEISKLQLINPDINSQIRSLCIYACREAKEAFFNYEDEFRLFQNDVDVRNIRIGINGNSLFTPKLNANLMDDILNRPIEKLQGLSWIAAFEKIISQSKEILQSRGYYPEIVLLTGGASRMPFIESSCKQTFSGCKIIKYSPPEETVSLGLTRWGKIFLQTSEFTKEISELCSVKLPTIIEKYKNSFSSDLSNKISRQIAIDCIKPALVDWRKGRISTLAKMDDVLKERIEFWINSNTGRGIIESVCAEILKPLTIYINSETIIICKKHGIPHSILEINTEFDPKNIAKNLNNIYSPFEGLFIAATILSFLTIIIGTGVLKTLIGAGLVTGGGSIAVAAVIGAWALIFGTQVAQEKLRANDLPLWIRENLMTDNKIDSIIEKVAGQIQEKLSEEIRNNQFAEISKNISSSFEKGLLSKANEVKWIID